MMKILFSSEPDQGVWAEKAEIFLGLRSCFPKLALFAIEGHTVSENADVKLTFEACPLSTPEACRRMREKAYGLDLHKKFILAAITDRGGTTVEHRFSRTQTDLFALRDWVLFHGCEVVACESTSDYWIQVSDLFAEKIPVIVGNARDIKAISHKKTDTIDAVWIAKLALHDLIPASRIPDPETRDLRSLVRLRKFLVEKRTDLKNQVHHILDSCLFRLSTVFSDIFGKSGMLILTGVTDGKPVEEILATLPARTRKRSEENQSILGGLGGAECEILSEQCPTRVVRLGVPNEFGEVASEQYLFDKHGFGPAHIAAACRRLAAEKA
ncbi:MAG: Transposase [Verrucomicrobia bacterium ADurb.Bin474]|nr:MAG: Transposase [Verrucomicrobia bacterium ADurb.Bin474]